MVHSGPENLKKSRPKKLVKSNKSIPRDFFWPKSIFCDFKNGQKSIFELGKSLKLPKMRFYENIFLIYWISRVFCLDSFKFSGPLWIHKSCKQVKNIAWVEFQFSSSLVNSGIQIYKKLLRKVFLKEICFLIVWFFWLQNRRKYFSIC